MKKLNHIVLILGNAFEIDLRNRMLRSLNDPDYNILFSRLHQSPDSYHYGWFDREREIYVGNELPGDKAGLFKIDSRFIDGLQMESWQLPQINRISQDKNWNTEMATAPLQKRLHGVVPEIEIGGNPYRVYLNEGILVHRDNPANIIYFDQCMDGPGSGERQFFYDLRLNRQVTPNMRMISLPADMILVTLPEERVLDPISVAIRMGRKPTALLPEWPVHASLSARIDGLQNTRLPEVVRRNQIEQEMQGRLVGPQKFLPVKLPGSKIHVKH